MEKPEILIIDDDVALQKAFQKSLQNEGYSLLFAKDGHTGLEMVKEKSPILIFLDLLMPSMSGLEFLQKIKLKPDDPYMVVVITGHGDDPEIQKCYEMGVEFFLRKPLSMVEVCCLARRCIGMKKLEIERMQLIEELQKAAETIKTLKRFLPICASCKKIRNDNGYWQEVETYFKLNADMDFSHSICPACVEKIYPELKKR